jgi:hypothetical protein
MSQTAVQLAAAREHSINSRRTRVHVIICHSLDTESRNLLDIFQLANRVSPEVCAAVARELAGDILQDVAVLKAELERIEAFARRQLARIDSEWG